MKKIDINNWPRKQVFEYFKTFSNPCYGFDVEMDIDDVYKYSKETKTSFFINFLFLLTLGLNSVEEMRTRLVNDEVIVYDTINPTYTIETIEGYFENGGNKMIEDYKEFYNVVRKELDDHKYHRVKAQESYNNEVFDVYYMTCVPWITTVSMCHPIPDKNIQGQSVPRICWSKYYNKDGRMKMMLNITVSHILCDGHQLANTFIKVQEYLDKALDYLK